MFRTPRGWGVVTITRAVVGGVLGAALSLMSVAPAAAHSELVASSPSEGEEVQSPQEQIVLDFTEAVASGLSAVSVINDARAPRRLTVLAGRSESSLVAALGHLAQSGPAGAGPERWLVSYRVTSADGHPVTGSVRFTVDAAEKDSSSSVSSDGPTGVPRATANPGVNGASSPDAVAGDRSPTEPTLTGSDDRATWGFLVPAAVILLVLVMAVTVATARRLRPEGGEG